MYICNTVIVSITVVVGMSLECAFAAKIGAKVYFKYGRVHVCMRVYPGTKATTYVNLKTV